MGKLGCTLDGTLDSSKFSEPMPWIGLYVAAASAICAVAMALDAFHGFRYRKLWFPCKFFSLNATTLTLIGVATKFSMDLNTSMPHRQDQLAKLSSAAFICTVMGNFMPSLGGMENSEILANLTALGILVITAIVNVCIQLGTGVIYIFWKEYALLMLLMLVLLAILVSSALTVPCTKCYFDLKYKKKNQIAVKECAQLTGKSIVKIMQKKLKKYWMMAHTCNPQFVMGRLATCTASGAFCLLSALALAEAFFRNYFMPWSFTFCKGSSDYKWSTTMVLVTQTIAVGVGTIGPAFRWFMAINYRCPKKANKACTKTQFKVENYWIQNLVEWKDCPFALRIQGRFGRRLAHNAKTHILEFCIMMQCGIVLASKLARLISILFMSRLLRFCRFCEKLVSLLKCNDSVLNNDSEPDSQLDSQLELSRFVLHLEGEEQLIELMMDNNLDTTEHWIRMGRKKQPRHLIQLLERHTSLHEFKGVIEFDHEKIPSLDSEEPPNCWALPVVTLTSIAIALPEIDHHSIKQLISSVHEGLNYVRLVESALDDKNDLLNIRKAAETVWLRVDIYRQWLDADLYKVALQGKTPKEILEELTDVAKNCFMEFRKKDMYGCLRESPSKWPIRVLAANSMYRICRTLLLNFDSGDHDNSKLLFERLSTMICEILGACLTNLHRAIALQCHGGTIDEREGRVREAFLLLGKTQRVLEILHPQPVPNSLAEEMSYIDNWRALSKEKGYAWGSISSSSGDSETASGSSSDLYLNIE